MTDALPRGSFPREHVSWKSTELRLLRVLYSTIFPLLISGISWIGKLAILEGFSDNIRRFLWLGMVVKGDYSIAFFCCVCWCIVFLRIWLKKKKEEYLLRLLNNKVNLDILHILRMHEYLLISLFIIPVIARNHVYRISRRIPSTAKESYRYRNL